MFKKCLLCKDQFQVKSSTHRVCSDCKDEYNRQKKREYKRKISNTKEYKEYQRNYRLNNKIRSNNGQKPDHTEVDDDLIDMYITDNNQIIGYRLKSVLATLTDCAPNHSPFRSRISGISISNIS